jgi:lysophospholipase
LSIADEVADYWAAALGRQLINRTDGGPEVVFSSIQNTSSFQSFDQPFPIVVIDSRRSGEYIVNINSTLYEVSPYEFGTFDSRINLFVPTKYVGSNLTDSKATNDNICVERFENAALASLKVLS